MKPKIMNARFPEQKRADRKKLACQSLGHIKTPEDVILVLGFNPYPDQDEATALGNRLPTLQNGGAADVSTS